MAHRQVRSDFSDSVDGAATRRLHARTVAVSSVVLTLLLHAAFCRSVAAVFPFFSYRSLAECR